MIEKIYQLKNWPRKPKRAHVKAALLSIIILNALVLAIYPFLPLVLYHMSSPNGQEFVEVADIVAELADGDMQEEDAGTILGNRLVIPKIGVNISLVGGDSEQYALSQGAWIMPGTSTPDSGSNTVVSGHRFRYTPPHESTFYLLDKLTDGDVFQVFWEGQEYRYKVVSSIIVSPYAQEVLDSTEHATFTMVTCNPLFSTKERLVVSGELI